MVRTMRSGQAMVEVIVGFAITVIGIVAVLQLTNRATTTSGFAQRQSTASSYASEGLNWVKGLLATKGWTTFYGYCGGVDTCNTTYCLNVNPLSYNPNPNWTAGACGAGTTIPNTEYSRSVNFAASTLAGKVIITTRVTVSFDEGSRTEQTVREYQFVQF